MAKTALLLDPEFERHDTGAGHPESPERTRAIGTALAAAGIVERCAKVPARAATDEQILRAHTEKYLALLRKEIGAGHHLLSTGDTAVSDASLDVALRAAGSALAAVDGVFAGDFDNAFCALRPPGHHATADRGMGFCVFNHVAVAARHAQAVHGAERVAIIDWDVHHGNGTQDIFYDDGSVFYFSTHQHPWYPGTGASTQTGEGEGAGATLNVPLPAGSGFEQIGGAFRGPFAKAMAEFKPDLVLVSAGFDSRAGDPLGDFTLTDPQFVELTGLLLDLAQTHAGGRLVSLLEGGYHIAGLAAAAGAHVGALMRA